MIWYPYEQMKTMKAPYKIEDANGPEAHRLGVLLVVYDPRL